MAYDEELAVRVREQLSPLTDFEEKKMFGGLAFMVNTHMACGLMSQGLMVRVGTDGHEAALARGGHELEMGARTMRGMVVLHPEELTDAVLEEWVHGAVEFAKAEPPKPPKKPKKK